MGADKVPAHYWYIAGSVYVYDQYISAYTGSPNAYSEVVEIPITINAASHGAMTLLDVQPNFYAYYKAYTNETTNTPLTSEQKLVINDVTYQLNDPISYWDYSNLPAAEKRLFVSDTYVTSAGCKIGNDTIYAGTVMRLAGYNTYKGNATTKLIDEKEVKAVFSNGKYVPFDDIFHSSNNMSHGTGYLLTYNVTNPKIWDKWYTPVNGGAKNQTGGSGYEDGPTYTPTASGLYGQQSYDFNAIIPKATYDAYEELGDKKPASGQATFVPAYLVTKECTSAGQHYYPGAPVSGAIAGYTAAAFVSTATIQLSPTEYIYVNDLMTEEQKDKFKTNYPSAAKDIEEVVKPAYICTTAGKYGGSYYEAGKNYRALEAYTAMSEEDRKNFKFNYDALDLLIDPDYSYNNSTRTERIYNAGMLYQYDSAAATAAGAAANAASYSLTKPIDYRASYAVETPLTLPTGVEVEVKRGSSTTSTNVIQQNDTLLNTVYESLPNEQHYYAPIVVKKSVTATTCYVVKETFVHANIPYAAGSTISTELFNRLSDTEKTTNIDTLEFESSGSDMTYYYCRKGYNINSAYYTEPRTGAVKSINGVGSGTTYTASTEGGVPAGIVISSADYDNLVNKQKNFIIHGTAPTETSTLYVARNADINDLSTEKIITVIYKYDYEESDLDGTHITPITERHVVNIHINFKSGVPTVEDINPPSIVLPGTGITMRVPSVTPGAYEITGGGWEIFEKPSDAESHVNGVPYTPSVDPLYWYQDGFYLAYYAKTYLGKTYSNHVPVSVANYHDLKRVMDDKENHLHVDYDRTRLKRDSKIYINDYSASSQNGLDLFKDLYDLSLLTSESTGVADGVVTTEGRLKDHHILNQTNGPKAGENLDFILRTDINHTGEWTSIASGDDPCFNGTFHGDGYTIKGLNNSLFNKLCGNVYNLGVTGSFTGAGVAETGDGYVENCWISTSSTAAKTNKPVFGTPTNSSEYKQIVNSYYMEEDDATNKYENHTGSYGIPTRKPAKAFYNGEVAYDLNGFYLYKRYNDGVNTTSGVDYKYFALDANGNIPEPKTPLTGHYANNMDQALCSSGYSSIKYVEDRFADGDFVFAAGEIPTAEDERFYSWTVKNTETNVETVESSYYPIWPDDYIFFGQKLTYGWAAEAHQNVPTAVVREDGRLSMSTEANRVYRAPAYYRSKTMGVAHFNPNVYLAQTKKDVPATLAYPQMTAIDFHGHYGANEAYGAYGLGWNTQTGQFYAPLLDDDGLLSIQNCDETQNLLVYAPSEAENKKTHDVLEAYFTEPIYNDHYDNTEGYRLVAEASTSSVHGHLVQSDLKATNDHLLVDKQDFNAPIGYTFDADHLMWYQRTPANSEFVNLKMGWQGISVPFTAELVTTHQKGEITHFYSGSDQSHNSTTKKGHEYWLREFTGITEDSKKVAETTTYFAKASFNYPAAADNNKTVGNTFLWDYYYKNESVHNQQDKNEDTYLQYRQYYNSERNYTNYPLLSAAKPYILGLPGQTYYEFDLSGSFVPQNTAASIARLDKQIITLASNTGISIGVSDDETEVGVKQELKNQHGKDYTFTFKPSYMNMSLESGSNSYALDNAGDSYDEVTATTKVSAFRPYFTALASVSAGSRRMAPKYIIFSGDNGEEFEESPETVLGGSIEIFVRGRSIVARSHLTEPTTIRIVNVAGIKLNDFVLEPGQTVVTPVKIPGVYMANKKKLFVK